MHDNNIFFIDITLDDETNGLNLAKKIREIDHHGYIIFLTGHPELAFLALRYKVRALDYILKSEDDLTIRINQCLELIYKEYVSDQIEQPKIFNITVGSVQYALPVESIIFFETLTKKRNILLHTIHRELEFRGTLDEIQKNTPDEFFRCHRSYLINIKHILEISKKKSDMYVIMSNSHKCLLAEKNLKRLIALTESFANK